MEAIGNVLRIDTFTASETRGRFARICVQMDVGKPLATAIMIGRLEQQICYEGIHKMCFGCGQLGHRKEKCPYIIRQEPAALEMGVKEGAETVSSSCQTHASNISRSGKGTSVVLVGSKQNTKQNDMHKGVYRPWIMMACRKNGTKNLKSGGTSPRQSSGFSFRDNGNVEKESLV